MFNRSVILKASSNSELRFDFSFLRFDPFSWEKEEHVEKKQEKWKKLLWKKRLRIHNKQKTKPYSGHLHSVFNINNNSDL